MFVKSLMVGTAVAVGLLALDVCLPTLIGSVANAEQKKTVRSTTTRTVNTNRAGSIRTRTMTTTKKTFVNTNNKTFVNKNAGTFTNRNHTISTRSTAFSNRSNAALGFSKLHTGPGAVHLGAVGTLPAGRFVSLGGRNWPMRNGSYRMWWNNGWRTWLPLTALGVVVVGGTYYWANNYVMVGRSYCSGITPDGCRLNWQYVGFEGGDGDYQCVQFCPRVGEPAPAQAVAMVTAPPATAAGCQLTIYAEPGLAGTNAPSSTDQPRLEEVGWKDQIASVKVDVGTWDFFTGDDFTGESMRLAPGPYPQLTPEWTKHIGSFMCVQGS
jgi:hypothetical protein